MELKQVKISLNGLVGNEGRGGEPERREKIIPDAPPSLSNAFLSLTLEVKKCAGGDFDNVKKERK